MFCHCFPGGRIGGNDRDKRSDPIPGRPRNRGNNMVLLDPEPRMDDAGFLFLSAWQAPEGEAHFMDDGFFVIS